VRRRRGARAEAPRHSWRQIKAPPPPRQAAPGRALLRPTATAGRRSRHPPPPAPGPQDACISSGSIFGVYSPGECRIGEGDSPADVLEKCTTNVRKAGTELAAAGYCLYSSATEFVLTCGAGARAPPCLRPCGTREGRRARVREGGRARPARRERWRARATACRRRPRRRPTRAPPGWLTRARTRCPRGPLPAGVFKFTLDRGIGEFVLTARWGGCW
jgi:hypothetical protein